MRHLLGDVLARHVEDQDAAKVAGFAERPRSVRELEVIQPSHIGDVLVLHLGDLVGREFVLVVSASEQQQGEVFVGVLRLGKDSCAEEAGDHVVSVADRPAIDRVDFSGLSFAKVRARPIAVELSEGGIDSLFVIVTEKRRIFMQMCIQSFIDEVGIRIKASKQIVDSAT